jgi:hypothetical protein
MNRNTKIYIATLSAMIWIYYRTFDCYALLPRKSLLSVVLVALWTYFNYMEPLLLPIGLLLMYLAREGKSSFPNEQKN